jgi:hypothetical protein
MIARFVARLQQAVRDPGLRGALVSISVRIAAAFVGLGLQILLARLMALEDYGDTCVFQTMAEAARNARWLYDGRPLDLDIEEEEYVTAFLNRLERIELDAVAAGDEDAIALANQALKHLHMPDDIVIANQIRMAREAWDARQSEDDAQAGA